MDRRTFIGLAAGGALGLTRFALPGNAIAAERIEKLVRSNAEWKKLLTSEQYDILREDGTERPYSSPLLHEKRKGVYVCAACDLPLFPSRFKYDSGTGWPSFYDVLPGHVQTRTDYKLIQPLRFHCAGGDGRRVVSFSAEVQPCTGDDESDDRMPDDRTAEIHQYVEPRRVRIEEIPARGFDADFGQGHGDDDRQRHHRRLPGTVHRDRVARPHGRQQHQGPDEQVCCEIAGEHGEPLSNRRADQELDRRVERSDESNQRNDGDALAAKACEPAGRGRRRWCRGAGCLAHGFT